MVIQLRKEVKFGMRPDSGTICNTDRKQKAGFRFTKFASFFVPVMICDEDDVDLSFCIGVTLNFS